MNFSAVILAGGKSSRMGRDKAFLEFEGKTLLARQVELAHEVGAKEIFISGRVNTDYSAFGCPVLVDNFSDAGPLAGIERALHICSTPIMLVLAVDMPNMTTSFLQHLAAHCVEDIGAIPRVGGRIQPLAAFYPKAALQLSASSLSSRDNTVIRFAEQCVKDHLANFIELPMSEAPRFSNWNAPPDVPKRLN